MKKFLRILGWILMILSVYTAVIILFLVMPEYLHDIIGNRGPVLQMLISVGLLAAVFYGGLKLSHIGRPKKAKVEQSPAQVFLSRPAAPTEEKEPAAQAAPVNAAKPSGPAKANKPAAATTGARAESSAPSGPDGPAKLAAPNKSAGPVHVSLALPEGETPLDDVSFVQEMLHLTQGPWHQYDVLLAAQGYGWATMLDWASYAEEADLGPLGTVTTQEIAGALVREWINEYRAAGGTLKSFEAFGAEYGVLAIGGGSRAIPSPVKIMWFNQTRVLRVYSLLDDELLMRKYIETLIRRSFGSPDAMRLAKPVPAGKKPKPEKKERTDDGSPIYRILYDFDSPDECFATANGSFFDLFHAPDYFDRDWADRYPCGHYVILAEERHSVYENGKCVYENPHFTGAPDACFRGDRPAYTLLVDTFEHEEPVRIADGTLVGNELYYFKMLKSFPLEDAKKQAAAASERLKVRVAVVRIFGDYDKC